MGEKGGGFTMSHGDYIALSTSKGVFAGNNNLANGRIQKTRNAEKKANDKKAKTETSNWGISL